MHYIIKVVSIVNAVYMSIITDVKSVRIWAPYWSVGPCCSVIFLGSLTKPFAANAVCELPRPIAQLWSHTGQGTHKVLL